MWQVLVQDTSFWTCFWFLFGATLNMTMNHWEVVSATYIYSSFEFIITSTAHNAPEPELTWVAYKVSVVIGIVFGSIIQPKGSPWLQLALLPGITLYFHPDAMYGVATIYLVSCVLLKYYRWTMYCTCVCSTCLFLPMQIGGAPLIAMTAPAVFGYIYSLLYDVVPETTYSII